MDQQYFNNPLRRDIVKNVFHYFHVKGVKRTKVAKTVGDVSGSGKKPAPQKGRGKARQGNKRAPQRKGGGAAHGPKYQDLTEKMPRKVRLKAISIMLSAKLFEDRIVLIDSEQLDFHRTKYINEILAPFMSDKLLFLTPFDVSVNFKHATSNLQNVILRNPQQLHVPDLVRSDLIFMTKQGLEQFEEVLDSRSMNLYRNKNVPLTKELPYKKYFGEYIKVPSRTPKH